MMQVDGEKKASTEAASVEKTMAAAIIGIIIAVIIVLLGRGGSHPFLMVHVGGLMTY